MEHLGEKTVKILFRNGAQNGTCSRQIFVVQWSHVRHQSKINIQKPKLRTRERRIFESLVAPLLPEVTKSDSEKCMELKRRKLDQVLEVNPFEEFMYKRCKHDLLENKMIAVCQLLPMSGVEMKKIKNKLLHDDIRVKIYNNKLMKRAVSEMSQYQNMMPYFCGQNAYIMCKEVKIQTLVKQLKKIPKLILLGGLVENHILSHDGFMEFSKFSGIEEIRGELVSVLNSSASNTSQYLAHHLQNLSLNLQLYAEQSATQSHDLSEDHS